MKSVIFTLDGRNKLVNDVIKLFNKNVTSDEILENGNIDINHFSDGEINTLYDDSIRHIKDKLIQHGCHPRKTFTLRFPMWLNENLYSSFIRGYFDGDGYIGLIPPSEKDILTKKNGFHHKFSLTGNGEFLRYISFIFNEKINVNTSFEVRHKERHNDIISISVSGGKQIERLYDYLYGNTPNLYLIRKHDVFKTVKTRNKR